MMIERTAALIKEAQDREANGEELDIQYQDVLLRALTDVGIDSPTPEMVEYLAIRVEGVREEISVADSLEPPSNAKSFATDFMKWTAALTSEEICLYAADYDLATARTYYEMEDRDTVLYLCKKKVEERWQQVIISFESCLFGFGGKYKGSEGDSDGNTQVFDLKKNPEAGTAMFGNIGLGTVN